MPVVHIPAFAGPDGMPVGVSLIARRSDDQHLLSVAKILSGPLISDGGWQDKLVCSEAGPHPKLEHQRYALVLL